MKPDIQNAILALLESGEMTGRELRARLKSEFGIALSAPRFYLLMARMEDEALVEAHDRPHKVHWHTVKRRYYEAVR